MSGLSLFGIAVGLAMDAFAVSIAAGLTLRRIGGREVFRIAFHFGLFQFMMPILGWLAGTSIASRIANYDHWLACGILGAIGGKMLVDSLRTHEDKPRPNPTKGWMLVGLSLATSLDALAVGLTMAFLNVAILLPCVVIGLTACVFSAIGITFGHRVLRRWRSAAELVGGSVLILIGIEILISHLTAR